MRGGAVYKRAWRVAEALCDAVHADTAFGAVTTLIGWTKQVWRALLLVMPGNA